MVLESMVRCHLRQVQKTDWSGGELTLVSEPTPEIRAVINPNLISS
jgi:hypothetical protein